VEELADSCRLVTEKVGNSTKHWSIGTRLTFYFDVSTDENDQSENLSRDQSNMDPEYIPGSSEDTIWGGYNIANWNQRPLGAE